MIGKQKNIGSCVCVSVLSRDLSEYSACCIGMVGIGECLTKYKKRRM
jgi:hypothetical protein